MGRCRSGARGSQPVGDVPQRLADAVHPADGRSVARARRRRHRACRDSLADRRRGARCAAWTGGGLGAADRRPLRRHHYAVALRAGHQHLLGSATRAERRRHVRDRCGGLAHRGVRRGGPGRAGRALCRDAVVRRTARARGCRSGGRAPARGCGGTRCRALCAGAGRLASAGAAADRRACDADVWPGGVRAGIRDERCGARRARTATGPAIRPGARGGRRRLRRLPRVLRRRELGAAGARRRARRQPGAPAGGCPRDRTRRRVGKGRVDHVRRGVVARPHQPAVRDRGAGRPDEHPAHGAGSATPW